MPVLFLNDIGETISTIGEKLVPNWVSFVVQFLSFLILLLVVFFLAYKPVKKILKKLSDICLSSYFPMTNKIKIEINNE